MNEFAAVRKKINAISLNMKIDKQKSADIRGYKLPINVQNFTQKDSAQAKISLKVVGGLLFFDSPCIHCVSKNSGPCDMLK